MAENGYTLSKCLEQKEYLQLEIREFSDGERKPEGAGKVVWEQQV